MENNSPHSAHHRARVAMQLIKAGYYNRNTGKPRMPTMPTEQEVAILRRAARGGILVTRHADAKDTYSYEDGSRISHDGKRGFPLDRFVKNGWIIPVRGEALFEDGAPQRYVVPKP